MERHPEPRVPLQVLFQGMEGRSPYLFSIMLCLPYLTPIPVPVLSALSGAVVAGLLVGVLRGHLDPLPQRWREHPVDHRLLQRMVRAASWILKFLERVARTRWLFWVESPIIRRSSLWIALMAAFLLMLPVPIPFANALPAWCAVLICLGLLERDGWMVMFGWVMGGLTLLWFGIILGAVVALGSRALTTWLPGWFG